MAGVLVSTPPTLIADLLKAGREFDFFQAVHLLERTRGSHARHDDGAADHDVIRFQPLLSLAVPRTEIDRITRDEKDGLFRMVVSFMGLYGQRGTLPYHYTELLLQNARPEAKDDALRLFLDIFNHRFISLFYRAHAKHRYTLMRSRSGTDRITTVLSALMGDQPGQRLSGDAAIPREHLLRYCGLLTQRPRSVATLVALISDYFCLDSVAVRQFVPRWVEVPAEDQGRLSERHVTSQLGRTLVLGGRIRDRRGKFRLRIGPLDLADYVEFRPGGRFFEPLCRLVQEFVGHHLCFDVEPVLKAEQVPFLRLSEERWPPIRLGRTTWLLSRPSARDADDVAFAPGHDLPALAAGARVA